MPDLDICMTQSSVSPPKYPTFVLYTSIITNQISMGEGRARAPPPPPPSSPPEINPALHLYIQWCIQRGALIKSKNAIKLLA